MGESKRRKQILGDAYGTPATAARILKKKSDAILPSGFLPDFGIEVASQIGEQPFNLSVVEIGSFFASQGSMGILSINLIPLQIVVGRVSANTGLPTIAQKL